MYARMLMLCRVFPNPISSASIPDADQAQTIEVNTVSRSYAGHSHACIGGSRGPERLVLNSALSYYTRSTGR